MRKLFRSLMMAGLILYMSLALLGLIFFMIFVVFSSVMGLSWNTGWVEDGELGCGE